MATTRFWPIKGTGKNLTNVIDYIENPEKTVPEEIKDSLRDVINYAANDDKTERAMYVSGINCSTDNAYSEFMVTKNQFQKTDGILAYHGYMSFEEGEVTAEEAHAIGVEFVEKNFPGFQVVVATHLNTDNIHNHFVVNSVSYEDGRRIHDEVTWFKFHKLADRICAEHSKSVIRKPKRSSVPEYYRRQALEGNNESYNILRQALDEAILASRDLHGLRNVLRQMGYRYNLSPNRKYWTITPIGHERGIRLYHLGEEYTNGAIMERLAENSRKHPIRKAMPSVSITRIIVKRYTGKPGMLISLYRHYMYLLGKYRENKSTYGISHAIKQDINMLQRISDETRYLEANNITLLSELLHRQSGLNNTLEIRVKERDGLKNELRRKDNDNPEKTRKEISMLTDEISGLRKEIRMCENIKKRSTVMEQNIMENTEERMEEHGTGSRTCDANRDRNDKDNA